MNTESYVENLGLVAKYVVTFGLSIFLFALLIVGVLLFIFLPRLVSELVKDNLSNQGRAENETWHEKEEHDKSTAFRAAIFVFALQWALVLFLVPLFM